MNELGWEEKGLDVKVWRCSVSGSGLAVSSCCTGGTLEYLIKLTSVLLEIQHLF